MNLLTHFCSTFISCCLAQAGVYGYAAYSASKFALVGMAQALQMEVSLRGTLRGSLGGSVRPMRGFILRGETVVLPYYLL